MVKSRQIPKESKKQNIDGDEKRLLILEYLYSMQNGASKHHLQFHTPKLHSNEGDTFKIFLQVMVTKNLLETKTIDLGTRQQLNYIISENGKKIIDSIKSLKKDENPLGELGIFDRLD